MNRQLILFAACFAALGASAQNRVHNDSFLAPVDAPDATRFLPAPPDTASIAYINDFYRYNWGKQQRRKMRGRQADFDTYWQADSILKGFAPVFGLRITRQSAPATYELLCKVCVDAELGVKTSKRRYMRTRPYVQYHEHTGYPQQEEELRHTGSYPSGHSARGWAVALVLSELRPDRQNEIMQRGYQYGESRVIEGYHYQSDVEAARLAASAVVARLHADAAFALQMEKAKRELKKLLPPVRHTDFSLGTLRDVAALQGDAKEGYQGMCISGEWLVSLQNTGLATLYKLPSMQKASATFSLGCCSEVNHANVAAFGVEKADAADALPLLYVSQAYKKAVNGVKDVCYVERIGTDGTAQTVQRIVLDDPTHLYGYALQWTVDRDMQRLIGFGNTISNRGAGNRFRIMVFPLPRLADGSEVHLTEADALENYTVQEFDSRFPSNVIGQGGCVNNGCLLLPTGLGKGDAPSVVYVWDLQTRSLRNIIDLSKQLPAEMEDIDFYNGDAYIQTNGKGMVKLEYKKQK